VEGYIIEDALMVPSGLGSSYTSSVVERRSFLAFQRIIFVLANGLWYSRAAYGLIAAAPERAPLKGSWDGMLEEASRRKWRRA